MSFTASTLAGLLCSRRCRYCEQGHHGSCEARFPLDEESPLRSARDGSKISHGPGAGAFVEYTLVDASQVVAISNASPSTAPITLSSREQQPHY